ncbi:MAG: hypothetical protein RLZ45_126 [Verrucomicrobiota bacterium]
MVGVSTDTKCAHQDWRNSERLLSTVRPLLAAGPMGTVGRTSGGYAPCSFPVLWNEMGHVLNG